MIEVLAQRHDDSWFSSSASQLPVFLVSSAFALLSSAALAMPIGLSLGVTDSESYGFNFNGVTANRESAEFTFSSDGNAIELSLTGFDIDNISEVSVFLNNSLVGRLAPTPNNSLGDSQISIPSSAVQSGVNELEFVQRVPGYRWGLTDLLIEESVDSGPSTLVVGVTDDSPYGFRYLGQDSNRERADFVFDSDDSPLDLTVVGFDIDNGTEVEVSLNGVSLGYLNVTADNSTLQSEFFLSSQALTPGTNSLSFEQRVPGYRWGVTDLLLDTSSRGPVELTLGVTNSDTYGFSYLSNFGNPESANFVFEALASSLLTLNATGFDIDSSTEVSVLINGSRIGYLSETSNNDTGPSQFVIPTSEILQGTNSLSFVQRRPGYRWGVTDIQLDDAGLPPPPPPPPFFSQTN